MNCRNCGHEIPPEDIAKAMGEMSRGKKKTFSKAERERRKKRLAEARAKRWPKIL
jgi:hypothetical protein